MSVVIPKVTKLSPSVIRILGCNPGPMTLQGTNTYIIGNGKRRALFDTGEKSNLEYLENLSQVLIENKIELNPIIISHWHHDHIGGLEGVLKLSKDPSSVKVLKFPFIADKNTGNTYSDPENVQLLNDRQIIEVEGASLQVLHTPGHTQDHVVLYLASEGAIFSGDCVLGEGTAVFEQLHLYMQSLQILLDKKPSVIYPGHGSVVTDAVERISFYLLHRRQREEQIIEKLKAQARDMSALEIVKILYTETPENLHLAAASNVIHHLTKLLHEGKVTTIPINDAETTDEGEGAKFSQKQLEQRWKIGSGPEFTKLPSKF